MTTDELINADPVLNGVTTNAGYGLVKDLQAELAAAVERERGLREALSEARNGIDWLAKEGCTIAEQAWSRSLLLRIDVTLATPPVDNQPAACGERME